MFVCFAWGFFADWVNWPVYTFGDGQAYATSACGAIAACARAWPTVLTSGYPGTQGVPPAGAGEIVVPGGLRQVTWYGQPVYLFSTSRASLGPDGNPLPLGNGNNIHAFGGTFPPGLQPVITRLPKSFSLNSGGACSRPSLSCTFTERTRPAASPSGRCG